MASVNDIYESLTVCTQGVQSSINVQHWRCSATAGLGATDAQIATQLDALMFPVMKPLINAMATYRGVGVRRLLPAPLGSMVSTIANLGVGTGGASPLPRQITGILTWRTALAGRRFRGRFYTPFVAVSQLGATPDVPPIPGFITALTALGNAVLPGFTAGVGGNTNTFVPVVFSRKFTISTQITAFTSQPFFATQRKRGSYGRPNPPPF